jgi:hypothetical protein
MKYLFQGFPSGTIDHINDLYEIKSRLYESIWPYFGNVMYKTIKWWLNYYIQTTRLQKS